MPQTSRSLPIDELPIALAVLDEHYVVLEANTAFKALVGKASDPIGQRLRQVFEAAGAVTEDEAQGKVLRFPGDDEDRTFRLTIRATPGGMLALLTEAAVMRARDDRHLVAEDVRARLMHDAEIGTWWYDPDHDTYCFPSELSLGYAGTGKPMPRETLQRLQHRDDRVIDDDIRERITREGGTAEAEVRYRTADGGWSHLRVFYRSGERLPSGRYAMHGVSQSITSLAIARDEARTNAQRLDLALKASGAGVFEYDYKTRAYWLSPKFLALIGATATEGAEADPFTALHPEDRPRATSLREDTAAGRIAEPIDVRVLRADGERWVRLYFEVDHTQDSRPRRGVGLIVDIDEAKRQEIAINEARRVAEEATAAKSDFLASVSHEIRTPMNGIVGVLNLLGHEPLSGEGRQLLGEALGCSEMLSQLINDVLDFSKIEAGKLSLSPVPTDLQSVVESVVRLLGPQAEVKGLYLEVEAGPELGWADIDPVRLRQCLFNVIGNAVKFTEQGGVRVRVASLGVGAARRIRFEIEDTGIGVPEGARDHLFGRFQQVDTGPKRRFGGTGLGLAISRQLARMMGGDLDYWSQEGAGSTFWFEMAAPEVPAPVAADAEDADAAPLAGLKVLVVDDNRVNRIVGVKTVEALGAEAEAVDSGAKAIEAVRTGRFDLVLMDINMPGMDGLEATRNIRALDAPAAEVPVIALTADVMRHHQARYLAAGMNGMAPKPFSPAQLLAEIVRICGAEPSEESLSA